MISQTIKKNRWRRLALAVVTLTTCFLISVNSVTGNEAVPEEVIGDFVLRAGDPSLAKWTIPASPAKLEHKSSEAEINLGRTLFFDKRLSSNQDRSCASCHRPELGWSDGLPTALGLNGKPLKRATPSLYNTSYATIFMWDGSANTLEEQALKPIFSPEEMGGEPAEILPRLRGDTYYLQTFAQLYPRDLISESTIGRAIAAFERTIVSRDTRFDQWIAGDTLALTAAEIRGFGVFLDPKRGSCGTCHAAPLFTDEGFHNIGLKSFGDDNPDLGRYKIRPVKLMRGAFKTPSLRNIALTAPYFHDGSAQTLSDVVDHYIKGGDVKNNLSPEMKNIILNAQEKRDLIAFLNALSERSNEPGLESIGLATD